LEVKEVTEKVKELIQKSAKRKFLQSVDISIALKQIDFKKTQINEVFPLPLGTGKKITTCALVDKSLQTTAKANCDKVILLEDFDKFKDKNKILKKLCEDYDIFIAQANIMPQIATVFGKVLGPRNKMPNPKAGSIVAPNADLKIIVQKLSKIVFLRARKQPVINCSVGTESMEPEKLAENIVGVVKFLETKLEKGSQNLGHVYIKTTMSPAIMIM